jgi:hypothetical protein
MKFAASSEMRRIIEQHLLASLQNDIVSVQIEIVKVAAQFINL